MTQEFLGRSRAIYRGMGTRFGEKMLPFTLDEFRVWFLGKFGDESKSVRCPYCQRVFVTVFTCVIDHATPASRGGSLDLDNLESCCKDCNDIKGAMGVTAFLGLIAYMNGIHPFDAQELRQRLQKSYKAVAAMAWHRKHGKKARAAGSGQ